MEGTETPVPDRDAEQMQADETVDVAFSDAVDTGYESDVAELFVDDGDGMDFNTKAKDNMVMALTMARATAEKAKIRAASMCKRSPATTSKYTDSRSETSPC